jgi:hypothetical protein
MLFDPAYFQAMFHMLGHTKALLASQTELGMANEALASACSYYLPYHSITIPADTG